MLKITGLETGYNKKQVLFGLNMYVREKEIVAIIGPNGAGKSTVLKAIFGLIPIWKGTIHFNGIQINGTGPPQMVAHGITLVPQGGRVFQNLTVFENLEMGGFRLQGKEQKEQIELVLTFFPILRERIRQDAGKLSGGEQQILALARTLVSKPKFMLLDEPSLGLSQNLVKFIFQKIKELNNDFGVTILIVEQKVFEVLELCNRIYSLKLGKVTFSGMPLELKEDKSKLKRLFL